MMVRDAPAFLLLLATSTTVLVLLLSLSLPPASADCCDATVGFGLLGTGVCRDCLSATPCCGVGACNILCCGCTESCRQGDFPICSALNYPPPYGPPPYPYPAGGVGGYGGGWYRRRREATYAEQGAQGKAALIFTKLDTDGDGQVSQPEMDSYVQHMYKLPNQTLDQVNVGKLYSFGQMDKDGDGFLSLQEIDE